MLTGAYAGSQNPSVFKDPWVAMTITLDKATPNIVAVQIWQSDSDNANGVTTSISVWLHDFGQVPTASLPGGNQRAFLSGVLCASGVWPSMGTSGQPEWRLARCNQTIGSPGAAYVTLQKLNNWVTYASDGNFIVAEVQILADGEPMGHACTITGIIVLQACMILADGEGGTQLL